MKNYFSLSLLILFLASCQRNPTDKLSNPLKDGAVSQSPATFPVYTDELTTGGGLGFIPGGENQAIALDDSSSPQRTHHAIRYEWSGRDVFNAGAVPPAYQHVFAGFVLTVSPDLVTLPATQAKDISAPGYVKMKFFARGSLSQQTIVRIEGPDDGDSATTPDRMELDASQLTNDWKEFELPLTAASKFNTVKSFMTVSFQYTEVIRAQIAGNGGIIYLDDIRYEK